MRKLNLFFAMCLVLISVFSSSLWAETKDFKCIEIKKFEVDRDNSSSKALERAADIPESDLNIIQHKVVGEVSRAKLFDKVVKNGGCTGNALIFGGLVTDYKKGNRTARILIGLGAGQQKFEVQAYLKEKQSGRVIAQKKIVDHKWAGWAGGDEDKGKSDFAEKIMKFIKNRK